MRLHRLQPNLNLSSGLIAHANPHPLIVAGSAAVTLRWCCGPKRPITARYLATFRSGRRRDDCRAADPDEYPLSSLANGSGAIEVPADKVRMSCVCVWRSRGCSKGGAVGFELLDQKIRYQPVQRAGEFISAR